MEYFPVTLKSAEPATLYAKDIKMFKIKDGNSLAVHAERLWGWVGEKRFLYINRQDLYDDYENLFQALSAVTNNMAMRFSSTEGHVVPVYRIRSVKSTACRLEVQVDGVWFNGWFEYTDPRVRDQDYNTVMAMMRQWGK